MNIHEVQVLKGILMMSNEDYAERIRGRMEAEYRLIRTGKKEWSSPDQWKPVPYRAKTPERGVALLSGAVRELWERNIALIKYDFAQSDYCEGEPVEFIKKMGLKNPGRGWSGWLPASNEARLLSGASHALRWEEDSALRVIVDVIVAGIKNRMRDDGYYNYYPEELSFAMRHYPRNLGNDETAVVSQFTERKNYDRVFWTRAMIAAHLAGNTDALPLARRMYDWFNAADEFLPGMLMGGNATNGLPGGPLMYHTELGKPEDIITSKRYFDQDYWMEAFAEKQARALSDYPGERPHCYDLLAFETLADEYRATGEEKYRAALLGGWELYRENYKHPGGATAICEGGGPYPPKSYYITTGHNGETCGSVFWIWVNHRLMQLYPGEEQYAAEIEEAIVNIILACRTKEGHTRYHNRLHGKKEPGLNQNTCCEVSSTNLISSLPEYIYMTGAQGLYINLYLHSELNRDGYRIRIETDFPRGGAVAIKFLSVENEGEFDLHLRIPGWARQADICVTGGDTVKGLPGSYCRIRRAWKKGDTVRFTLPFTTRTVEYSGFDQAKNSLRRYALFHGPLLMALTGDFAETDLPCLSMNPEEPERSLIPRGGLRFAIEGRPAWYFMPYYEVDDEVFTCFPVMH
jgi:DUF1680 family protein